MADAVNPVAGCALSGDWGALRGRSLQARWSLRGAFEDVGAVAAAWGDALPSRLLTVAGTGDRAAMKLGPDEWLLLGVAAPADAAMLAAAAGRPCSLVDVSDRSVGLELSGPAAATILNAGSPLDLADAAFPPGTATRTVFGKAEIVLWRPLVEPVWRIEVWRSFADYVSRYLAQAVADL